MATNPEDAGRMDLTAWTEDMDTSRSRLLTPGGPREASAGQPGGACCGQPGRPSAGQPGGAAPAQPSVACALGPSLESVGIGRRFTRTALRRWDLAELCDQAELVVSELVTNAIRHGLLSARRTIDEYPVGLRLLARAPFVTCLVTDPGSRVPVRNIAGAEAENGRGLHLVEACSLRWGWRPLAAGGKVVWALLRDD